MANESTYKIVLDDKQAKKSLDDLVKKAKGFEDSLAGIAKASIDAARGTLRMSIALKQAAKEATLMKAASAGMGRLIRNYIQITTAADKATAATKKLNQETGQISGKSGGIKAVAGNLRGMGQMASEGVAKLRDMAQELFNLGQAGSQLQQLSASYEILGGSAAEVDMLREATKNMVPDSALKSMRNMGTLSGLTKDQIGKLAKVSTGAAQALGRDFEESFNRIIQGTAKKEREFFDELGITLRSMVVVYKEFADGAGKKVSELTEKEKSLAFTNEVLRASSVQLEVGNKMAADSFGVASAQMGNYSDAAKMLIADTLKASGAIEAFLNMGDGADLDMTASIESLTGIINSAALVAVGVFEALLAGIEPLLAPLSSAMALFEALVPILKIVSSIVGTIVGGILRLINAALVPLAKGLAYVMSAAADAAYALGQDGLGDTLRQSATGFEKFAERSQAGSKALDENKKASEGAADAAIELGNAEAQLALDSDAVTEAFRKQTKEAKKLKLELIKAGNIKAFTIQSEDVDDSTAWINDIKDARIQAVHTMKKEIDAVGGFKNAGELGQAYAREFLKAAQGDEERAYSLYAESFDALEKKAQSIVDGGVGKLAGQMTEASAQVIVNEAQAALSNLRVMSETIENEINQSADKLTKSTAEKERKQAKARRQRVKDDSAAHAAAILAGQKTIMSARAFADQEREKEYTKIIGDLEKFGENALAQRVRIQKAFEGFGRSLGDEFIAMSESMKPMIEQMEKAADAFGTVGDSQDLKSLAGEYSTLAEEQERIAESSGSLAEMAQAQRFRDLAAEVSAMNDDLESQKRAYQALEGTAIATGGAMASLFGGLAEGAKGTDEIVREVFGQLFMDLSATMIAWASAEIAALSSPFLGLVASLAFKAVAATIGGVIKRKPAGGGGGASQANASRKASEGRSDRRKDRDQPAVTVFNYGFSAPDEITQSVSSAERRATRLRGK